MSGGLGASLLSGGTLSLARLAAGIFRIKVLAVLLGLDGVGIFSWLVQIQATGITLVSMSLAVPIINLGRPYAARGELAEAGKFVGTAIALIFFNFIVLLALFVAGHDRLAAIVTKTGYQDLPLWPIVFAIAVTSFSGGIWEGIAFLVNRFDLYVRVGVMSAIADAAIVALAAWQFGLKGLNFALLLSAISMFGFYAAFTLRVRTVREALAAARCAPSAIPPMLGYSATMLLTTAAMMAATAALRAIVLDSSGAAANGALQVPTAMSGYLQPFILTGFWGHLHPRAAEHGDVQLVREEFRASLRLGSLLSFAGTAGIAVVAPVIVPIIYSSEFSRAIDLVTGYMAGEFAFQVSSMFVAYFLVIGRRRAYVTAHVAYVVTLSAVAVVAIARLGPSGYVVGHVAASVVFLGVSLAIATRLGQIEAGTAGMLALGTLAAMGIAILLLHGDDLGVSSLGARFLAGVLVAVVGLRSLFALCASWAPVAAKASGGRYE